MGTRWAAGYCCRLFFARKFKTAFRRCERTEHVPDAAGCEVGQRAPFALAVRQLMQFRVVDEHSAVECAPAHLRQAAASEQRLAVCP